MSDNKNSKGFNLDANLVTQGDISIQGNLNVKGKTNTINQETLTVKDNLIAVNGGGVTLTTAQMAGVVAITGGENLNLSNGTYYIDTNKLCSLLKLRAEVTSTYDSPHDGVLKSYRLVAEDPDLVEKIANAVNSLYPDYYVDPFDGS
jgi:large exoprotein involved in heme utilization and adhesion